MSDGAHRGVDIGIAAARPGDSAAAARLHREQLSDSFLSGLGEPFLRVLYRRIAADSDSVLLTARRGDRVVGFISGTTDTGQFYRRFVRTDGLRAGVAAAPRLARHPLATLETLRYGGSAGPTDLPPAELLSLAVHPDARRGGAGSQLIAAFLADLRSRGVARAKVTVGAENAAAIGAYRRGGFVPASSIEVHRGHRSEVLVWG